MPCPVPTHLVANVVRGTEAALDRPIPAGEGFIQLTDDKARWLEFEALAELPRRRYPFHQTSNCRRRRCRLTQFKVQFGMSEALVIDNY